MMSAARKLLAVANMPAGPERDALKRLADEEHAREWGDYTRALLSTPGGRARALFIDDALSKGWRPDRFNNGR